MIEEEIIYHGSLYGWGMPVVGVGDGAQATYFDRRTGWYKNKYGANLIQLSSPLQSLDGTMHMPVDDKC